MEKKRYQVEVEIVASGTILVEVLAESAEDAEDKINSSGIHAIDSWDPDSFMNLADYEVEVADDPIEVTDEPDELEDIDEEDFDEDDEDDPDDDED